MKIVPIMEILPYNDCKLINMTKCQAFHVGSNRGSFDKPYLDKSLQWPNETFKYIVILVPIKTSDDNDKKIVDLNYAIVIDKTKSILKLWFCRKITLIGKITIIEFNDTTSYVGYKASMLPLIFPKILHL